MARLAHTGTAGILVIFNCCGSKLHRSPAGTHVALYQPHIGCRPITQINMRSVAIRALNILIFQIVVFFTGMTVGTDIQCVRRATDHTGAAPVGAQQIAIATALVKKIGAAINRTAARIGEVNSVTG